MQSAAFSRGAIVNISNKCDNKSPSPSSSRHQSGPRRSLKSFKTSARLTRVVSISYLEQSNHVHPNGTSARKLIVIACLMILNLQPIASTTNNQNSPLHNNNNRQYHNQYQYHYHNHPHENNWPLLHYPQNCQHPSHYNRDPPVAPETSRWNQNGYQNTEHRTSNNQYNQHNQQQYWNEYLEPPKLVHLRSPTHQQPTNLVIRENQLNLLNNQQLILLRQQQNQFLQQQQRNDQQSFVNQNEFFIDHQLPVPVNPLPIIATTVTTTRTETETNEQQFNKQQQKQQTNVERNQNVIVDIDECLDERACGRGATCENLPGSFSCSCPPGFTGDPQVECIGKSTFTTSVLFQIWHVYVEKIGGFLQFARRNNLSLVEQLKTTHRELLLSLRLGEQRRRSKISRSLNCARPDNEDEPKTFLL